MNKKVVLSLVSCAFAAAALADGAVRTSYADPSRIHSDALRVEREGVLEAGWCPAAFCFVPVVEWPCSETSVSVLRLSLFVGRHLDVNGLDIGGIGNSVTREFNGLQVSSLFNCIGETRGAVQVAGGLNRCEGTMSGLQVGLVNFAEKGAGVQLGLVNYGNVFTGLQLGAINVIASSTCPAFPIVNFAF